MTTLNDVYQHYMPHKEIRKKQDVQYEDKIEEFDGEVTGYAMQAPMPSGKVAVYNQPYQGILQKITVDWFYYLL